MSFWMVGKMEAPPRAKRMEPKPRKKELKVGALNSGGSLSSFCTITSTTTTRQASIVAHMARIGAPLCVGAGVRG